MQGLDVPATSRANSFATLGSIGTPSISTTTTTVASNSSVKSKSRFGLKSKLTPLFRTSSAATTGTSLTFSSLSTESSGTPSTTTLNSNGERQKRMKSHGGGRRYVKTKAAASSSSLGSQPSIPQVPQPPKPAPMEEMPSKIKAKVMGGGRRHVKTTVQPIQSKIIVTEPIVEKKVKTVGGGRRHVKPRKKDNLKTPEIRIVTTSTDPVPSSPSSPPALTSPITLGLSDADPFASSSLGAVPYLPTPPSTSPLSPSQFLPPPTSPSPAPSPPPSPPSATLAPEQLLVPVRYSTPVENPVAGPSTSPSRPLRPLPQPPRPPQPSNNGTKVATPTRTAHRPPSSFHRLPPSPSSSPSMLPYLSPDSEPEVLPEPSYLASRRRGYSASQARQAEEIPLQDFSQSRRPVTSTGLIVSRQATIRYPSRWQRSPRDRYAMYPPPPPYSARPQDHQEETHMQAEVEYLEDQTCRLSMLSVDSSDTYYEDSLIPLFPTPHPLPPVAPLRVRASVDRNSAITPLRPRSPPVRREPPGRSSQLPRRPRTAPQPSHEMLYMRRSVDDRDYRDVVNDILLSVEAEEPINVDEVIPEENELDSDESDIDPMMSLRPGYRRERQRARHMERMAMYTNGTLNPGGRARPDADVW